MPPFLFSLQPFPVDGFASSDRHQRVWRRGGNDHATQPHARTPSKQMGIPEEYETNDG